MDAKTQNHLDGIAGTAAIVREFDDFSDVAAVANFNVLERNHEALIQVWREGTVGAAGRVGFKRAKPVGDVEVVLTEVALEDVDVVAVGRILAILHGANRGGSHSGTIRGRVDEVRERTLQIDCDEGVVGLVLTALLVLGRQEVLNVRLVKSRRIGTGVRVGDRADHTTDSRRG